MVLQDANVWEGAGPSPAVARFWDNSSAARSVYRQLVSVCQQSLTCQRPFFPCGFPAADPARGGKRDPGEEQVA